MLVLLLVFMIASLAARGKNEKRPDQIVATYIMEKGSRTAEYKMSDPDLFPSETLL